MLAMGLFGSPTWVPRYEVMPVPGITESLQFSPKWRFTFLHFLLQLLVFSLYTKQVSDAIATDEELKQIRTEVFNMAQDKEVQNMLLQEKYERMDWVSYGNDRERDGEKEGIKKGIKKGRKEGRKEGIKEGKREGEIEGVIKLYHDEQKLSTTEIVSNIMKRFDLTKEKALGYVKKTLMLK